MALARKPRAFKSILVPLDGSPLAEQIIPLALEIAHAARSKLRLVLVHQSPPPPMDPQSAQLYVSIDLAVRKREREYLTALRLRLHKSSGLRISAVTIDGSVGPTLVKYVKEIGAELVMMSTHGHGGLRVAWLGSVADYVIRSLNIPVLVVRSHETQQTPASGDTNSRKIWAAIMAPLDQESPGSSPGGAMKPRQRLRSCRASPICGSMSQ
jgi:nucleotide-binding universal stress UspA family protein